MIRRVWCKISMNNFKHTSSEDKDKNEEEDYFFPVDCPNI